jgi:hypothetical protein
VIGLGDRPGRASRKPKRFGLFVEADKTLIDECGYDFSNLGQLPSLHFCSARAPISRKSGQCIGLPSCPQVQG